VFGALYLRVPRPRAELFGWCGVWIQWRMPPTTALSPAPRPCTMGCRCSLQAAGAGSVPTTGWAAGAAFDEMMGAWSGDGDGLEIEMKMR
jgi:hypothetical protein